MWSEFLNQSRSQRKFENKPLLILGGKHSGKRTLIDSLIDTSKTTIHNRRLSTNSDNNKMRLKGLTTAVDYAYLNVLDINDPDNRTHTKLEVYMVEDYEKPSLYAQLARPEILKNAIVIIMLDFTAPWNFMSELDKWIRFINQLQQLAALKINELDQMAKKVETYYKTFKEPEFDENGKFKKAHIFEEGLGQEIEMDLPEGTLVKNIRLPFIVCVNKCDLQSQVLRDDSANKLILILYHLRSFCVQYGGSLIYTSIRNNCNIDTLYEYILHRAYTMPLRFKVQSVNEEAIFIPFGYDNANLIKDSVVKIDLTKTYEESIPPPLLKKQQVTEIACEEDSEYFKKYINLNPTNSSATTSVAHNSEISLVSGGDPSEKRATDAKKFFEELLTSGNNQRVSGVSNLTSQKLVNAERELSRHTALQINASSRQIGEGSSATKQEQKEEKKVVVKQEEKQ